MSDTPLTIRMHERDNVAIVANDGGLPAGSVLPVGSGAARPRAAGPQGGAGRHRRRRAGAALRRPHRPCAEGHRRRQLGARAAAEDAGGARRSTACRSPPSSRRRCRRSQGYTFEGYRNADGSVGTRNILAITHDGAVRGRRRRRSRCSASRPSCCRATRTSTTWSALEHSYGCGVAIDAPDAVIPIRTLRNISLQPELRRRGDGGQPGLREAAARAAAAAGQRSRSRRARRRRGGSTWCCLQDDGACRLHVDDRLDPAPGRGAPASA